MISTCRNEYNSAETGFYYLQSRFYDPAAGRFINADNMSFLVEDPNTLTNKNMFLYCDNNPSSYVKNCKYFSNESENIFTMVKPKNNQYIYNMFILATKFNENEVENNYYASATSFINHSLAVSINGLFTCLSIALNATEGAILGGIGLMVTLPVSIVTTLGNENLSATDKAIICIYNTASSVAVVAGSYALSNCWNVTGWVVGVGAIAASIVIIVGDYYLTEHLEND